MFGVGDQVVCINDSEPPQSGDSLHHVKKGEVYTVIRMENRPFGPAFMVGPFIGREIHTFVFLAEVPSPKNVGFFAFRFRKVEKKSKETDISIFQEIADGSRVVPIEDDAPTKKVPEKVK